MTIRKGEPPSKHDGFACIACLIERKSHPNDARMKEIIAHLAGPWDDTEHKRDWPEIVPFEHRGICFCERHDMIAAPFSKQLADLVAEAREACGDDGRAIGDYMRKAAKKKKKMGLGGQMS